MAKQILITYQTNNKTASYFRIIFVCTKYQRQRNVTNNIVQSRSLDSIDHGDGECLLRYEQ